MSSFAQPTALPTCFQCGRVLSGSWTEANGKIFHPECFKCHKCHQPLGDIGVFVRAGNKIFCRPCRSQMIGLGNIRKRKALPNDPSSPSSPNTQTNYGNSDNNRANNNVYSPYQSISNNMKQTQQPSPKPISSTKPETEYIGYTDQRKTVHLNNTGWQPQQANQLDSNHITKTEQVTHDPRSVYKNQNTVDPFAQSSAKTHSSNVNMDMHAQAQQQNQFHGSASPVTNHDSHVNVSHSASPVEQEPVVETQPMQNELVGASQELPLKTQMSRQEIDDWNDLSTAHKQRDFIGINDFQKKQQKAKQNEDIISDANTQPQMGNEKTSATRRKPRKKEKFKLFGR